MYEQNDAILKQVVAEKSVIRHISKHRNPDGSFDLEGNLKIWNDAIARFEQIPLWEDGAPGFDAAKTPLQPQPSIIFVPARNQEKPVGTIVVAHGGGFSSRTGCEGMHIADYFAEAGFNTAILTYRLEPYTRRDAIADMQRAIRILRHRREELGITDKVAVMGFSAGGMLSGNCATQYDRGNPEASDPIERESCRPDAAVLGYGAFANVKYPSPFFSGKGFHTAFQDPNRAELLYLAPEKNITVDTPPFFIWQTLNDMFGDPRHSFVLGQALTEAGIPFEMHIFPEGVHGLALADGNNDLSSDLPHTANWSRLCAEWLRIQGF